MKSLVTITRLAPIERQLVKLEEQVKRVADGIEAYLRIAHNYNLTAPKKLDSDGEESIEYSDDEKTTLVEAKQFLDSLRIKPVEDE